MFLEKIRIVCFDFVVALKFRCFVDIMITMCLYPRFKREHCLKVSLIKIKALLFTEVTTAMVNLSNILRDLFFIFSGFYYRYTVYTNY